MWSNNALERRVKTRRVSLFGSGVQNAQKSASRARRVNCCNNLAQAKRQAESKAACREQAFLLTFSKCKGSHFEPAGLRSVLSDSTSVRRALRTVTRTAFPAITSSEITAPSSSPLPIFAPLPLPQPFSIFDGLVDWRSSQTRNPQRKRPGCTLLNLTRQTP